jgi:acyl-[acyl carrier protein]--UDP-N-acetylglucosamine O-acyltransferase
MKRGGFTSADIDLVREMYGIIVRSRLPFSHRVAALEKLAGSPLADEFIAFVKGSKRGVSTRHGRVTSARSAGGAEGE